MDILKPSIAKFISFPTTFVVSLILIEYSSAIISDQFTIPIDDQTSFILGIVIALLLAYIVSSIIYNWGKNHKRILVFLFTVLSIVATYFLISLIVSFFGLCLTNMELPCGEGSGPCHVQSQCPLDPTLTFITWLGYGIMLFIFVSGIISFVKEGNKKLNKVKK